MTFVLLLNVRNDSLSYAKITLLKEKIKSRISPAGDGGGTMDHPDA